MDLRLNQSPLKLRHPADSKNPHCRVQFFLEQDAPVFSVLPDLLFYWEYGADRMYGVHWPWHVHIRQV